MLVGLPLTGCKLASNSVRSTRDQPVVATPPPVMTTEAVSTMDDLVEDSSQSMNIDSVAIDSVAGESVVVEAPVFEPEPEPEPAPRPRVRDEPRSITTPSANSTLGGSPKQLAVSILLEASRSQWPQMRANAMEALIPDQQRLRGEVVAGLVDQNRGVRFVALMSMYEAKLCELQPMAEELLADPSESVRAAAILALKSCGARVDPSPLAAMARSSDPEVRANAFMVLGLLGNPSAEPLIRDALGESLGLVNPNLKRIVELEGATALVRLGDENEIQPLRAALFTPSEQGELVLLAIQSLTELKDEGAKGMLVRLVEAPGDQARPAEIRLAAATALARLGLQDPQPYLRLASEYLTSPDPAVRAQVAILLGFVRSETGESILANLMQDSNALVRLSAAGSVVRHASRDPLGTPLDATAQVDNP
ncbi:MAG: HEAT repeat domain-containing protein [Planctomycetota bacterium]|nr:HEAT repeat domain-containing protein [Planctomycetota bacterium]